MKHFWFCLMTFSVLGVHPLFAQVGEDFGLWVQGARGTESDATQMFSGWHFALRSSRDDSVSHLIMEMPQLNASLIDSATVGVRRRSFVPDEVIELTGDDFYPVDDPEYISEIDFGGDQPYHQFLFQKGREILEAPLYNEKSGWLKVGLVAAGIHFLGRYDGKVTRWVHDKPNHEVDQLLKEVGPFGEEYAFITIGGFYAAGYLFKSERARLVARDGLTSSIIAAGVISPLAKGIIGRERPRNGNNPNDYQFFGGGTSFPSGHTTEAFALAGSIAAHYDQRWVKVTSYGIASLVGLSRIEEDAHYLSDVAAGALLGIWVSRKVTGKSRSRGRLDWRPYVSSKGVGLSLKFKDDLFKR